MLNTCEALLLTMWAGVPYELWLSFWLVHPYAGERVRHAFLMGYGLQIATIEMGEPPVPVDVVRPDLPVDWVEFSLFVLSPAGGCVSGCEQSRILHP